MNIVTLIDDLGQPVYSVINQIKAMYSEAVSAALEKERLITEIAVLAQVQVDEVKEYYRSHTLTLETIRAAVSMGLALDDDLWDNYKRAKIAETIR